MHSSGSRTLKDRVLVVTGATRRIGREIAVRAAADGAAIGVTAEHPLPVTLRAQSWSNDYSKTAGYERRLGRMALTAANPWDLVIGNL